MKRNNLSHSIILAGLLVSSAYAQSSSPESSTSHKGLTGLSVDVNNGPTSGRGVNVGLEIRPIGGVEVSVSTGAVMIDTHGLLELHIGIRRWAVGASGNFMSMGQQMDPILSTDNVTIDARGTYNVEISTNTAVNDLVIGGPGSFPNVIVQEGVLLTIYGRLSLVSGSLMIAPGAHVVVFGSEVIVNGSESFNVLIGDGGSIRTPYLNVIDMENLELYDEQKRGTVKPKLVIQGDGSIGFGASVINLTGATLHIDVAITIDAGTRFQTDAKSKVILGAAVNIRGAVTLQANLQIKSAVVFSGPMSSLRVANAHFLAGSSLMASASANITSAMIVDDLIQIEEGAALGLTLINTVARNYTISTYKRLEGSFTALGGFTLNAGVDALVATRI